MDSFLMETNFFDCGRLLTADLKNCFHKPLANDCRILAESGQMVL